MQRKCKQDLEKNAFISYSKHLRDKKRRELKQIQSIGYNNEKKHESNIQASQVDDDNKSSTSFPSKSYLKWKENSDKQNWIKIDQKASIVNGKLVVIEEEKSTIQSVDQLIAVLKNNQIRIKDYIYGDKAQILSTIQSNYQRGKSQQIQRYINKNMKEEDTVEANCSDWYNQNKQALFDSL